MPLPTPRKGQTQSEWMATCMGNATIQADFGKGSKQAVAVCLEQWRRHSASEESAAEGCSTCCQSCARSNECETMRAAESIRVNASRVREVIDSQGHTKLVFPTVMMLEGVRQAANAPNPELLLRSVFEPALASGKHIPLVYLHPRAGDSYVSVKQPHDPGTGEPLGFVAPIRFHGKKMIGMTHMYRDLAVKAGPAALQQYEAIKNRKMVEVSVGHSARILPFGGTYHGKPFFGIHAKPNIDHLAILAPGGVGACSVKDGCGAPRAASAA